MKQRRRPPRPRLRQLELARNRLKYTVLRASRTGVVTAVRFEAGQVVAEGQSIVSIANEGEPEIVADVPEDHLTGFKGVPLQGMASERPRADIRGRAARAFAASGSDHANLPRPLEAGGSACAAARRDRHAGRRALGR